MSNIVDFNKGKKQKGQNAGILPSGFQEIMDATDLLFRDLPQNEMMSDAADAVRRRISKLMLFTVLASQANEAIGLAGLDPSGFVVDEMSLDMFIIKDIPHISRKDGEDPDYFNGPFFEDDGDDRWVYRVATTVFEEGEEVGIATDVMRLDRDAESWEMWFDGKWRNNGPPASIFEAVAMDTVKDMIEEITGTTMQELFEDDDEDWENSIESLLVTPGIIAALGRAGIETIDQLAEMTEKEVLAIKGIGKKALEEIKDALDFENRELKK